MMNFESIKGELLDGNKVSHKGWSIKVTASNHVVMQAPDGESRTARFIHLDSAVKDFIKAAGIPDKTPKPISYPKPQKGVLGPDTSTNSPWKDPAINQQYVPKGKKSDPKLGPDTSTKSPWKDPVINKRPQPAIGRGGLPNTDLGPDSSTREPKWGGKKKTSRKKKANYEVIVGGMGSVYNGDSEIEARDIYEEYVMQSSEDFGDASGEPVVLLEDGEAIEEFGDPEIEELDQYDYDEDLGLGIEAKRSKIIDTFAEKEAGRTYQELVNSSPEARLLKDIGDPEKWAANRAIEALGQSSFRNKKPCTNCDQTAEEDKEALAPSWTWPKDAWPGKGNNVEEEDVEAGCHGGKKGYISFDDWRGVKPPKYGDPNYNFYDEEELNTSMDQRTYKDFKPINPTLWNKKDEDDGKKSSRAKAIGRRLAVQFKENWDQDGKYSRDIQAETPEELYHVVRSFGSDDDYDWSKYAPRMPEEQTLEEAGMDQGYVEAKRKRSSDPKAKEYWKKYFGEYGKKMTEGGSEEKGKKEKKDTKKESLRKVRSQATFDLPMDEVEFTIECLPEAERPEGFFAYDSEEENEKVVKDIYEKLEWNEWAWCTVKVTAEWNGFTGEDYLGGVSADSEKDFIENSGYYEDMKGEAYADLVKNIQDTMGRLKRFNGGRKVRSQAAPANMPPGAQMSAPSAPSGQAPAAPSDTTKPVPQAPKAPKAAPATGAGDEGVKALGWTDEDIMTMTPDQKQKIIQVKLTKPGTQGKAPAPAPAPVQPKSPAAPATPAVPESAPAQAPVEKAPAAPAPVAARMNREKIERSKIKTAFQRLVSQAMQPQTPYSLPAEPAMSLPGQEVPAAPAGQKPAQGQPGKPGTQALTPGSAEEQLFNIYQEILNQDVSASSPIEIQAKKANELMKRALSEVGMSPAEVKKLFGKENLMQLFPV